MDKNQKFLKVYRKPSLTRYGKLTELTRGGGAAKKDGGKKTKVSGQA